MNYERERIESAIKMVQGRFREGKTVLSKRDASKFRDAVFLRSNARPMRLEQYGADIRVFDGKTAMLVPLEG